MKRTFSEESKKIVDGIVEIFERIKPPLTVRQVYYQLASVGLVPLSRSGYRQAQRLLLLVREKGIVPWEHFADRTRRKEQASSWKNAASFARAVGVSYRKDYWQSQPEHVEFWLEKDAMSGVVKDITDPYGVALFVARGFSSASFVFEASEVLRLIDKPKFIYYLGDHDPSGLCIETAVQKRMKSFGAEFHFKRLAISMEDIEQFDLRPLEAKPSDSRYKDYVAKHGDRTVELDALPPQELRRRITDAIEQHIDGDEWSRLQRVEEIEQASIRNFALAMQEST